MSKDGMYYDNVRALDPDYEFGRPEGKDKVKCAHLTKVQVLNQIAVLRQSAKQLVDQANRIISYCEHVNDIVNAPVVDWGGVALPVSAEDVGTIAMTCVKRAVKLDVLITMAAKENENGPSGFGSAGCAPQTL